MVNNCTGSHNEKVAEPRFGVELCDPKDSFLKSYMKQLRCLSALSHTQLSSLCMPWPEFLSPVLWWFMVAFSAAVPSFFLASRTMMLFISWEAGDGFRHEHAYAVLASESSVLRPVNWEVSCWGKECKPSLESEQIKKMVNLCPKEPSCLS